MIRHETEYAGRTEMTLTQQANKNKKNKKSKRQRTSSKRPTDKREIGVAGR